MNENVKKIFGMFGDMLILSILESPSNYIVSVCDKNADPNTATENLYAIDKRSFNMSEFSYFKNPDEYAKACDNVVYRYNSSDELAHHGILGMRWGIRRYQNKDGSLTSAGKRRRAKLEADIKEREKNIKRREREKAANDKLAAKSAELDERERALRGESQSKKLEVQKPTRRKTVGEMSNEELAMRAARMQLEKQYYDAQRNLAAANPPKVSAGQKFVKVLMNEVIAPAAISAGKDWATKFLKDKLGVSEQKTMSMEDRTKAFKLKMDMKNEPLEDIRRQIQILKAQEELDARLAKMKK